MVEGNREHKKSFEDHSFRVGDRLTWTNEALHNASRDLYDGVYVIPGAILEVVEIGNQFIVKDDQDRIIPINPNSVEHLKH